MAALVAAIHAFPYRPSKKIVDGREKPGRDDIRALRRIHAARIKSDISA
jgi:hypothetical protein